MCCSMLAMQSKQNHLAKKDKKKHAEASCQKNGKPAHAIWLSDHSECGESYMWLSYLQKKELI